MVAGHRIRFARDLRCTPRCRSGPPGRPDEATPCTPDASGLRRRTPESSGPLLGRTPGGGNRWHRRTQHGRTRSRWSTRSRRAIGAATASIVTEYRGLSVAELAELRDALAQAGGDYKIFKNTLVRLAIDGGEYQPLEEYLSGPTALTFVEGDISAVAKALRDFARNYPLLVIKGGLADGSLLSPSDLNALADLPPREVLLARLAGALAAPMQQMAGLLEALPRNLAYGIAALRDQRLAAGESDEAPTEAPAEAEAQTEAAAEQPAEAAAETEGGTEAAATD